MNASSNPDSLQRVHDEYDSFLEVDDHEIIDLVLAVRIAHEFIDAEALALIVVGPSATAKTELVAPLGRARKGYLLSDLTPKTLLSGLDRKAGNPSLILELTDHVIAIKDLTTVISGRDDHRGVIFGHFREIFDGAITKTWGNGQRIDWKGKVSIIAASTPSIDQHFGSISQLGTRFLYVRTALPDAIATARAALDRGTASKNARGNVEAAVADFVDQFAPCPLTDFALPAQHRNQLIMLAQLLALARTHVARDRQNKHVTEEPTPEGTPRAVKSLHAIAAGLARIKGRTEINGDDMKAIERLTFDSIPSLRCRLLRAVAGGACTVKEIVLATKLPSMEKTIRRTLDDLQVLGVLRCEEGKPLRYFLNDVSSVMCSGAPLAADSAHDISANPTRVRTSKAKAANPTINKGKDKRAKRVTKSSDQMDEEIEAVEPESCLREDAPFVDFVLPYDLSGFHPTEGN